MSSIKEYHSVSNKDLEDCINRNAHKLINHIDEMPKRKYQIIVKKWNDFCQIKYGYKDYEWDFIERFSQISILKNKEIAMDDIYLKIFANFQSDYFHFNYYIDRSIYTNKI